MHRHLVAVKVGVECRTDERMDLDRFTLDQHRLKSLDTETVKRRRTVQQDGMLADDLLENVPNDRLLALDHFACLFDGRGMGVFFEFVINKWLEQFQSHFLRQTALMQLELGADHDHRTSRVIDTLAEQILTKTSL